MQYLWDVYIFICFNLIRLAIVEELAKSGADIYTCALEQEELDQCLQDWSGKGYKVSGLACNLTVSEDRENLMKTVGDHFNGKLDILVSYTTNLKHSRKILIPMIIN